MQEYEKWFEFSSKHLICARLILTTNHVSEYAICYHSYESVEKVLRAYLLYKTNKMYWVFDLSKLMKKCLKIDKEFECLKDDVLIFKPYKHAGYPDVGLEINLDIAKDAVKRAERIFEFVSNRID